MKLTNLRIQNYRRCKDVELTLGAIHAIVGSNNAGKSTILRALDFLFNASTRGLTEEAFWNGEAGSEIRVEATFESLTENESEQLKPYLRPDGSFKMARSATKASGAEEPEEEGSGFKISQSYSTRMPKMKWLRPDLINGNNIKEWFKNKDELVVNGVSFVDLVGKTPKVSEWQDKAAEFTASNLKDDDFEEAWGDNPKGYPGILKSCLPFFVLVPAVRDLSDEAKVLKTNPFGRLLTAVVGAIASEKRAEMEEAIQKISKSLNREGGGERLPQLYAVETDLNRAIGKIFEGCDLEIEFTTPTIETLLGSPRLFVNDGFRGQVEYKGHGLQRAVIFSILRNYADVVTGKGDLKRRTLILAVEEPELYMHPLAQRAIRKLFKEIANSGDQIIYTTHSALQLEVADFDEVIRVEGSPLKLNDDKIAVCSSVRQLPSNKMVNDEIARHPFLAGKVTEESIREHYSHAYNRSRNEGFFAKKVLLVEGDTEEYSLPIYAAALGIDFDLLGISVIESGGKGPMDRLFRVFNELGIPVFMLFDYDENNKDPNIVEKSKELLELVGEPTDVPTGFYCGKRAACFQANWEQTMAAEVTDYPELEKQATQFLGKVAGKPIRARFIARALTNRTPPVVPASIEKAIQQAIQVECGPSCLKEPKAASPA